MVSPKGSNEHLICKKDNHWLKIAWLLKPLIREPLVEYILIIMHAGPVGWMTLSLLLVMSITCWAIIVNKFRLLKKVKKNSQQFMESFWKSKNLENLYESSKRYPPSPVCLAFQSAYVELIKLSQVKEHQEDTEPSEPQAPTNGLGSDKIENVERVLRRTTSLEMGNLQKYLSFLATTGSTAPFIGLFGTVIGIMRSFRQIGLSGSANLAEVAPGISEALLATAAGLAAAIPAVIAYNFFRSKLRSVSSDLDNFSSDFLNIIKRHFVT